MIYLLLLDLGGFFLLWVVNNFVYFEHLEHKVHPLGHILHLLIVELLDSGIGQLFRHCWWCCGRCYHYLL
jgi:hypothetical protein